MQTHRVAKLLVGTAAAVIALVVQAAAEHGFTVIGAPGFVKLPLMVVFAVVEVAGCWLASTDSWMLRAEIWTCNRPSLFTL
eukprot:5668566-Amphidinium_carterae.1